MTKLTKTVVNCETGLVEEVELTDAEVLEVQQREAEMEVFRAERDAEEAAKAALKLSARTKLVAGEPLTEEEAAVLVI
jgi:hypothetical protein